jgi:hypothetical protein
MKEINKTLNGALSFCRCCNAYQLEFGNVFMCFHKSDFSVFQEYLKNIDAEESVRVNEHKPFNRKIMLRFPIKNVFFCLNSQELEELRALVFLGKVFPKEYLLSPPFLSLSVN